MTAPTNDLVDNATVVPLVSGPFTSAAVDNTEATLETFETDDPPSYVGSYSVWWQFTPDQDLLLDLDPSVSTGPVHLQFLTADPITNELNLVVQSDDGFGNLLVEEGTTSWLRMAADSAGITYQFNLTVTVPSAAGDLFSNPFDLIGEEGTLELDLSSATLDAGEGTPSGVTRTLWGVWEPPSEDTSRERFRITQGNATLRLYAYDPVGSTLTQLVESTAIPADILVTDLDVALDPEPVYMLQIGLKAGDPDAVTLEWFSGDPSEYNDFADALEIDPVYGSQTLSLMNNTLETGETAPAAGVDSTGWVFFTAEEDAILNFELSADLVEAYTVKFYSGTALGSLTLLDTIESLAGEDVIFYEAIAADTTYYLQFGALDDYINFEVDWYIEGVTVDPYVDPEAGDEAENDDTDYTDVDDDDGTAYVPEYDASEPDEESEF